MWGGTERDGLTSCCLFCLLCESGTALRLLVIDSFYALAWSSFSGMLVLITKVARDDTSSA